jgi:hypothetical protein
MLGDQVDFLIHSGLGVVSDVRLSVVLNYHIPVSQSKRRT